MVEVSHASSNVRVQLNGVFLSVIAFDINVHIHEGKGLKNEIVWLSKN